MARHNDNAPVGHTCPLIDSVIAFVENNTDNEVSETEIKDEISQDQNTTLEKKDDLEESPKEIFTSEKKEELEVLDEKLELEGYELLEEDKVIHKEREKNN